ncbi:MAG: alpha/beta fold hydrolase [Hydrogenophaga sp.]|uniref:alpha/beta fold hydrolase n=1 Tax=Hydrogenophaga sp. TaxID=1904254 RepID=UPI001D6C6461|nr:alpha/beta fold hydrolase [Hydrogenophaga sp.]MBW0172010.1 alpha/beta fold hydrolase [Hydrogenophaga sp.]MBW0185210.1 alpha/beta fold hydrolase [Hydrogenophaga sp.]
MTDPTPHLHSETTPGPGRALVLVHPIGASLRFWDPLLPHLQGRMPVLRCDLRGHGASAVTPGDYDIDQLADDLLAVADAHGLASFDLCGVSLGGMVALAVAARAGERVNRVVVSSSAPRVAPPPNGWDGRRQAALQSGMAPLAGPMVERMFSAAFRERADPMVATLREVFETMSPVGYAGAVAVLRDADLTDRLAHVRAPTMVVAGQDDPLCPPEKQHALADALPSAQAVLLDCGHFPPVERPAEFARLLLAHLAR